jgi:WD40 repeat protein/serine/threonine protein kinase
VNDRSRHELIGRIMQACLEAPASDRAAVLRREAGHDESLIRDVEALLAFDGSEADDVFSDAAIRDGRQALRVAVDHAMVSADGSSAPSPPTIRGYRVIRRIGEGGMGIVYEAEQDSPRRRVALKVIRAGVASQQLVRRLRQEADLLARLQHPGIAHVYESGFAEFGNERLPYFAMELIHGSPLTVYAADAGLNTRARLELLARVADAVQHAHQKGVIHRDLKPANILVVDARPETVASEASDRSGAERGAPPTPLDLGQPRILDFGIARLVDTDPAATSLHTQVGQIVGTLAYMSPEQVEGDSTQLDTRCDIYALGVIAYELMVGKSPHDLAGRSIHEAARRIREDEPTRVSTYDPALRGDVETIISKAMQKDPSQRYASAGEFAADLRRHLRDEPIAARPTSTFYQLRKFTRRHRVLIGGLVATFSSLVLGLAGITWFALGERQARKDMERIAYMANLSAAAAALRAEDVPAAEQELQRVPEDRRGWEWNYLNASLDESRMAVAAPGRGLGSQVAFGGEAADEIWLLRPGNTADDSFLRYAWRAGDLGDERRLLLGDVISAAMPRLAGTALTTFFPHRCSLLDGSTGDPLPTGLPEDFQYSLDLAARRINFANWPRDADFRALLACAEAAVSDAGRTVLYFSDDGRWMAVLKPFDVSIWDVAEARLRYQLPRHPEGAAGCAFSADGRRFVTAGRDRALRLWHLDAEVLREQTVPDAHTDAALAVAFSPDGRMLASGGQDRLVRLWNSETLAPIGTFRGHRQWVTSVEFSRDGRRLASCDRESVRVWNVAAAEDVFAWRGHTYQVRDMDLSRDGRLLASVADRVLIRDVDSGRTIAALPPYAGVGSVAAAAAFSPDGTRLAIAETPPNGSGASVRLIDMTSGAPVGDSTIDCPSALSNLAFDPTGRQLAASGSMPDIIIWRADDLRELSRVPGQSCAYDPSGRYLVTAYHSGTGVFLFDAASLDLLHEWRETRGRVAISPDGETLAVAGVQIELYAIPSGAHIRTFGSYQENIRSVAFSSDGSRLLTGSNDRIICIWDPSNGDQLLQLRGHLDSVDELKFTPDGTRLLSGSGDYTVRLWDTRPGRAFLAAREEYDAVAAQLQPRIRSLFDRHGTAAGVREELWTDGSLTQEERRVASQLLLAESIRRRSTGEEH